MCHIKDKCFLSETFVLYLGDLLRVFCIDNICISQYFSWQVKLETESPAYKIKICRKEFRFLIFVMETDFVCPVNGYYEF